MLLAVSISGNRDLFLFLDRQGRKEREKDTCRCVFEKKRKIGLVPFGSSLSTIGFMSFPYLHVTQTGNIPEHESQGKEMTNTHRDIMTQTLPLKYLHATSESK